MEFENLKSFDPSVCISGKIMRLNRITANVFRKYLMPYKITDSQLSILFVLIKKGGLTQKQLSNIVQLEKSSLNRNLKRLFDKNYLSRVDFPTIQITHLGKSFVNSIVPEWRKAMDEISELLGDDGKMALDLVHKRLIN
ncbi:MarR family winged helix-turn-helix transcriptional regulator [Algoriphagus persicinus]|uniref:MarR family winged helix-turn-helix transcriptional regulator n=1 Tax=Algoriphagus persicinus TaxID=3108754 RepID=UPI002B393A82|nr:MarR family transcriptional regulator [Algoriphagus sp. E1-3-M2]MEB2786598.1 MarR family transcriptional regulator [Algoriphagus sp. E1-3-M2]